VGVNARVDWLRPTPSLASARHRFFNTTRQFDLVTDRMASQGLVENRQPLLNRLYIKHKASFGFCFPDGWKGLPNWDGKALNLGTSYCKSLNPSNFDSTIPSANAWKSSTIVREVDSLIAMCTVAHKSWSEISVLILPAVWTSPFSLGSVPAVVKVVSFITNPQGLLIHLSHAAKASLDNPTTRVFGP